MKIIAKVTSVIVFDYPEIPASADTPAFRGQVGAALEAGWRFGAHRDVELTAHVLRQQFGRQCGATIKDLHFDLTFEGEAERAAGGGGS